MLCLLIRANSAVYDRAEIWIYRGAGYRMERHRPGQLLRNAAFDAGKRAVEDHHPREQKSCLALSKQAISKHLFIKRRNVYMSTWLLPHC